MSLGIDIVIDHHFLAPHHSHAAHLVRIEPTDVYIDAYAIGKVQGHEDNILNARLDVGIATSNHLLRFGIQPVAKDREVMRRKIPERVNVLTQLTQVEPL